MKLLITLRTFWEEVKLRCRVLWAAASSPWGGEITPVGRLYATRIRNGKEEELGLISTKVVTTAGVNYLVDGLQSSATDVSLFRFHASGTDATAESSAQTALITEVATRTSGTQAEGASPNIYRTVGTIAYSGTFAIVEHGIFSAASAGTLLDRSTFAPINVISGDSIQFTYELTVPAGS
ncbi:MAG TPA: hypothetical protein V6D20_18070 [Candidatus Obscuribacterales bacterium]